jgi:hypothetical protein
MVLKIVTCISLLEFLNNEQENMLSGRIFQPNKNLIGECYAFT